MEARFIVAALVNRMLSAIFFFDRFGERYAIDWLKQVGGSEASLVFAPYHANK